MSPRDYIASSLRYYRRSHTAVALGVAVATAVLTGALLVGDCVRGSLRALTLDRLGAIDHAVVAPQPFREALAEQFTDAHPALLTRGTLEFQRDRESRRASNVSIIGCNSSFASLGAGVPSWPADTDGIFITAPLADELDVASGDEVLMRVALGGAIPADSLLGEKTDTIASRRVTVINVLPATGLARFNLQPSQRPPRNVFVPLANLQELMEQQGAINAILLAGDGDDERPGRDTEAIADWLRPKLQDYGVQLAEHSTTAGRFLQISSETLVIPDAVVAAAERGFGTQTIQPIVTYLANTIRVGERSIPYSTITGVDSTAALGPLLDEQGQPIALADDEIALNQWAADDLEARVGDRVTITYYEPASTHGVPREAPSQTFRIRAIVPLVDIDGTPTAAADPNLTPELAGVTDQRSINDWDLPFRLVEPIRRIDEDYWDEYSTTPKAFVSLATARRLWASRWGSISLLRLPMRETVDSANELLERAIRPAELGFAVLPIKEQGLAAAAGTTPFDLLFLIFSCFLLMSAVMLVALLFQLGAALRAREFGTLSAVGISQRRQARWLTFEALVVAVAGATLGALAGIFYAWLIVLALSTIWVDAVATPFLQLYVTPRSLLLGWLASILVTWLAMRHGLRGLAHLSESRLLAGLTEPAITSGQSTSARHPKLTYVLLVVGLLCALVGWHQSTETQAGAFFASGTAVLVALLWWLRHRWQKTRFEIDITNRLTLHALALRNAARHPSRSVTTAALTAAASFLVLSVSAFRLDGTDGGTGQFDLVATSDRPLHFDVSTSDGRAEYGFSSEQEKLLHSCEFYSLRVLPGQDASCLSLYQSHQPRILGVPDWSLQEAPFLWAGNTNPHNPWQALHEELGQDGNGRPLLPVIIDLNTAMYGLHLYGGVGAKFPIVDNRGEPITCQIVGLLKNSMLQGDLLISERHFTRYFPDENGYRMFLVRAPDNSDRQTVTQISRALETTLGDFGFDAEEAAARLAGFLAVQNTYLATFQSLGVLGLLLGTVGLAVVQLRSVIERRSELALMRAGGFGPARLVRLVLYENFVLLVSGVVIGGVAAAVALIPHWLPGEVSVPWLALFAVGLSIAAVGLLATWFATRRELSAPLMPALRGD